MPKWNMAFSFKRRKKQWNAEKSYQSGWSIIAAE